MTIEISERHLERISLHSRKLQPIEACGILIGTKRNNVRRVTDTWPAKNVLFSESSYEIDPESLFSAFTYADKNRLEVVAFYHSHPFWSAEASAIDKARANYPGTSYVIYSIPNKDVKSFYFDGKELRNESVIITADEHPSN